MHDMNDDIRAGLSDLAELALLAFIASVEFAVAASFAAAVAVWLLIFAGV